MRGFCYNKSTWNKETREGAMKFLNLVIIAIFLFLARPVFSAGIVARQQEVMRQKQESIKQQAIQAKVAQQQTQKDIVRRKGLQPYSKKRRKVSAGRYGYEEEVVDIEELWFDFETSSESWSRIIEFRPKEATVEMYIQWYGQNGTNIRKAPTEYVKIIDHMVETNPSITANPFKDILKIAAIIEYDFDNGRNKDVMARHVLGGRAYNENKRRLGR